MVRFIRKRWVLLTYGVGSSALTQSILKVSATWTRLTLHSHNANGDWHSVLTPLPMRMHRQRQCCNAAHAGLGYGCGRSSSRETACWSIACEVYRIGE